MPEPSRQGRQERKTASRQRMLGAAARALRAVGPERVNVAAVMREAGLTHGGFYAHFPSKDALLAAALAEAGTGFRARLRASAGAGGTPAERLGRMAAAYLSHEHVADRAGGCPIAALASELPRAAPPLAAAFAEVVEASAALIAAELPPAHAGADPRAAALGALAIVVGGLVLARAAPDAAEAEARLAAARAELGRWAQGLG
jgi:TetR/AcrR family transcriptional repressor of nem operon